ncbi:glucose-6-phosphate exchanger SLC37A2 isoform X2 [Anabrus simplex]|uniref:glucose-6-phosphate exchanger SLC37A2 isoform X2 n=1 Tax=Anabrus simplex TaxID=316456 RepID=UPI0034DD133A
MSTKVALQYVDVPLGIKVIQKATGRCCPGIQSRKAIWYRSSVLILTFISYTCYHLSRKPISVVKTVLHQNCSNLTPPADVTDANRDTWCSWAPFEKPNYSALLGTLDSSFLFAYGAAMFVSGFVAERVNLRYFLALGMIFSGIFSYLFGIGKSYGIHDLWYYIIVQILGGIVQTTGWPGVVTVIGNWFGEGNRGLIFGIWNSHTSLGNILGSLIAGEYVETDWSLSFIVPGIIIAAAGFLIFLFLVTSPSYVGCSLLSKKNNLMVQRNGYQRLDSNIMSDRDDLEDEPETRVRTQESGPLVNENTPITSINTSHGKAIGFLEALKIPGVVEFSLSLFFAKLVSYTFLYWLPQYINHSTSYSASTSALLSTLFDVGGIIGGITAGVVSDYLGMNAITCGVMLILAVPMMLVYDEYGSSSYGVNVALLIIVGILVNGPYALITTAVAAELGTHESLEGNAKALATVAAIIDGTGSIGAAVGPLLAGVVAKVGWEYVFYMLMASDVAALLCLCRLAVGEAKLFRRDRGLSHVP